jgi:hypothetical protein
MALLYDYIVIVRFMGIRPSPVAFNSWLANLSQKVRGSKVLFDCNLRRKSFLLKTKGPNTKGPETVRKFSMFTTFKTNWGMCIFQGWVPSFNSNNPQRMKIPTWITLRKFPIEFQNVGQKLQLV